MPRLRRDPARPCPGRAAALAALACIAVAGACGSTGHAHDDSDVDSVYFEPGVAPAERLRGPRGALSPGPWDPETRERCRDVESLMRVAAMEHRVDLGLIAGLIHVESAFRPTAKSRVGARGLMQIMPSTGKRLDCGDLEDPEVNIRCGVEVLKRFLDRYDDDLVYGLSAYNAGYKIPNAAREAGTLPSNYRYVEKVLAARVAYLRHGCAE